MTAEVIIYSTATCPYCDRAKELLRAKGVSYTEYRVDEDMERLQEMMRLCDGRRSVPQIIIGGQAVGGFDDIALLETQGKLDDLLQL